MGWGKVGVGKQQQQSQGQEHLCTRTATPTRHPPSGTLALPRAALQRSAHLQAKVPITPETMDRYSRDAPSTRAMPQSQILAVPCRLSRMLAASAVGQGRGLCGVWGWGGTMGRVWRRT